MAIDRDLNDRERRATTIGRLVGTEMDEAASAALETAEGVQEAARFIRQMRQQAELTQDALGRKLGVTQARISELEKGGSPEGVSYALLRRVANACGFGDWPAAPLRTASAQGAPSTTSAKNLRRRTTQFFDPEFLKSPDVAQWQSEFTRMFTDFSKFWSEGTASTMDANWLLTFQRKNIEALTGANQRAFEGVQAIAKRQVEIARAAAEEMTRASKDFTVAGSTEDKLAKQPDVAKESFETAVAHLEELAGLAQKSQAEAFEVIRKRVIDNFDEVRAAFDEVQGAYEELEKKRA